MAKQIAETTFSGQAILFGTLSGRTVKKWRNERKLSAARLGRFMDYTRAYVKAIEGGSLPVSKQFALKFREVQQSINGRAFEPEPPRPITVASHYELPASIEVLAKPVRCRGCGKWIVPRTTNQRGHTTKACQRKAEKKARKRRARHKSTGRHLHLPHGRRPRATGGVQV